MVNLKKNILIIIATMLIIVTIIVPTTVCASDGSITIITPGGSASPAPSPVPTPNVVASPSPSPKVTATPTSPTKLPQTGIEDYTGLIIVTILLGASALFAYKKIKDYDRL